jgi:hypothetical protein
MNKKHLYTLTVILTITGLALFLFKLLALGFPFLPDTSVAVWNIEAKITFEAKNKPIKVSMFIPRRSQWFTISNEHFVSRGYGLTTTDENNNRKALWSIRNAKGNQAPYYKALIRKVKVDAVGMSKKPEVEMPEFEGPYLTSIQSVLSEIKERSADVKTLVTELIKKLSSPHQDSNIALLLTGQDSVLKKMELAADILAYAGIPARPAHGIKLKELERNVSIYHWLEVYDEHKWISFDPQTGLEKIDDDFFPWWRGNVPLGQIEGAGPLHIKISVSLNKEEALVGAIEQGRLLAPQFFDFSLFALPIETQTVYHVLLLLPIGAFILVIFRNMIGIKTFGTFMPILIALAFRETRLIWGIVLFSSLVAIGLTIRFYFERLKLLLVPRLASLLIVVVLIMTFMSILSHKLGLERGLSVALFPMVIMTMTIERMSIVWEERGAAEALQQGFGSLVVAAVAYLVMINRYVEHFFFVFPETLLILLAATLLLGRYTGYRLWELFRFREFTREQQ